MNISIDDFKAIAYVSDDAARVKIDDGALKGTSKGFLGRAISIMVGTRQEKNKAVYEAFKEALAHEYGDIGKDVLTSIKPKDKTRLSAQTIRQILHNAETLEQQYTTLGIPYNDKTKIGEFLDLNLTGPMKKLGSGAFNTVYKGTYKFGDGTKFDGVFKKEEAVCEGWTADKIGIDLTNPQLGARNVATYQLSKLLGFDVIPRTEFAAHNDELGVILGLAPGASPWLTVKETTFEVTEARVKGTDLEQLWPNKEALKSLSSQELEDIADNLGLEELRFDGKKLIAKKEGGVPIKFDFTDPTLRKELTKLQWLDALCGQGDRHAQNYFVELDKGGHVVGIKGIDNDQAFGNTTDPNDLMYSADFDHVGFRGCHMPSIIDTDTVKTFKDITPQKLEESLQGLLTDDEIDSCKERLLAIKARIDYLETENRVIDPNDWGGTDANKWLQNKDYSYVARDKEWQLKPVVVFKYSEVV